MAMMFSVACFIFGVSALSATTLYTSAAYSPERKNADGWDFIKDDATYEMKERNFFLYGNEENTECLISTLKNKNDTMHRVDGYIKYRNRTTKEWVSVNQSYQFSSDSSGGYNIMSAIEPSQGPHGVQTFVFTAENCAGVTVVYKSAKSEASKGDPEARAETDEKAVTQCILWLRHDAKESDAESCQQYLKSLCGDNFHTTYDRETCPKADN
uniref:Lipocalin n=1 Tax=Rhipicephalus zambeziensis TaxID=60191 RepID=A0A224YI09_9ACAR